MVPPSNAPIAFDAHNHVHLSIPGGIPPLAQQRPIPNPFRSDDFAETDRPAAKFHASTLKHTDSVTLTLSRIYQSDDGDCSDTIHLGGIALMSTQPRDFPIVDSVCESLERHSRNRKGRTREEMPDVSMKCIRCYGVHPWFLHEADSDFEGTARDDESETDNPSFLWLPYLREKLAENPSCCVGEIGLDGARYDPVTGDLMSPMTRQVEAFEAQITLAADLQRPVSVHAVKAWGPMFDALRRVKKNRTLSKKKKKERTRYEKPPPPVLPPSIYFHAFGGKPSVVDQLNGLCQGSSETYYGFAPCINFRSPKTMDVIRKVGIDRLVLETDLEDHTAVLNDLNRNVNAVADALCLDRELVLKRTTENARRLYGL